MDDLSNGAKVAERFRAPLNGAKVEKYLIQLYITVDGPHVLKQLELDNVHHFRKS